MISIKNEENDERLLCCEVQFSSLPGSEAKAETCAFAGQDFPDAACILMSCLVQPEIADREGQHGKFRQPVFPCRVECRDIAEGNIAPEFFLSANAFVIVQEISAAVKNELPVMNLYGLRVVR